jgi:sodium transport system ATP-binding protein
MPEITNLCDRVIFLARGRVVLEGAPQEIIERTQSSSLDEVFISVARSDELHEPTVPPRPQPAGAGK